MSLYGVVANGAYAGGAYLRQWQAVTIETANSLQQNTTSEELNRKQVLLNKAYQELSFANDVLTQIVKSIKDLQP